jgi:ubiquinone/menaquinone biosynthesis C-methylase UbiE
LQAGDRVVDLGCGTGNVALLAAQRGARVIAVDPARRLLDVTAMAAADIGLTLDVRQGAAPGLPVADDSQDVVLSNFGLVFTHDPAAAVADVARVLSPGGRLVFNAWVPGSTMDTMVAAVMRVLADAGGQQLPPPDHVAWHEPAKVEGLLAATGRRFDVTAEFHQIAFHADSPQAYLDGVQLQHPLAVVAFEAMHRVGADRDQARSAMLEVLAAGNEDMSAFRTTSRYVVYVAR